MEVDNIILDELREFRKEYKEDRRSQELVNDIVLINEEKIKNIMRDKEETSKRVWRIPVLISTIVALLSGINITISWILRK